MPLQFQILQAPCRFGLAEGIDPHQVPFGTLLQAENACWNKSGLLDKRHGSAALTTNISGGGSLDAARRLIVRGNELALTDGTTLYSYVGGSWVSRGRHPEIGLEWDTVQDSIDGVKAFDLAYLSNGQVVQAWATGDPTSNTGSATVTYQILDRASNTIVTAPTVLNTGCAYRIRVLSDGTNWVILWNVGGALKYKTASTTGTLKSDARTVVYDASLDACIIGTEWVVAYALQAGGIRLVRYSFAATPVQQATVVVAGEVSLDLTSISIAGASGETLYITYADENAQSFRFASANPSTLAQVVAPTNVQSGIANMRRGTVGVARETSTTCILLYSFSTNGGSWPDGITRSASITNAGLVTVGQYNHYLRLLSRPFFINSRAYAVLGNWSIADTFSLEGGITGSDTFLVDATVDGINLGAPCRQVGKLACLIGGIWGAGYVSNPVAVSSDESLFPLPFVSQAASNFVCWRQGVQMFTATAGASVPDDMWRTVEIGQEAYLAAGVLTSYDGLEAVGYGWAHAPYLDYSNTVASAAGGALATGSYIYAVTGERLSAAGVLHRGPVGAPVTRAVTGPTGSVSLGVVPVGLSYSAIESGHFPIFRTVVGGTVLQRLTIEPTHTTLLNQVFTSSPSTVVDTKSDIDIATLSAGVRLSSRPALYTQGGELEDHQPVGCVTATLHQNRIWIVAGDGRTVWFSKDATVNPGVAPGFYPTSVLPFEQRVTALQTMDEKLIVFAEDSFWYVIGVGPAPSGQGGDYQINSVQTDVGCTNARSVVSTPDGLMFLSTRGIYLLTRSLELVWIGRPVKDQLASFPDVTSAVLVASRNEVRFTANDSLENEGIVLVYNYVEKQWSTSKYKMAFDEGLGRIVGTPIADACMHDGVYTFVTPLGVVYKESTSTYLDGSTWVPLTIETAWNNAGGPLAFQSVRNFSIEGISRSHHDLTVSVDFDNEGTYPQTKTFAAGSAVTSIGPLESCTISIGTRRKCQAIRFKIKDATPSTDPDETGDPVGTGQGLSIDMLGIEVGLKKGFATKSAQHTG